MTIIIVANHRFLWRDGVINRWRQRQPVPYPSRAQPVIRRRDFVLMVDRQTELPFAHPWQCFRTAVAVRLTTAVRQN
jgi:hypothetical protein